MDELSLYYGAHTGGEIDSAVSQVLNWESAGIPDIASINITGTTNDTGATIPQCTFFYVGGALVTAKTDIADGAPLTDGTNYEAVTAGGLNAAVAAAKTFWYYTKSADNPTIASGNGTKILDADVTFQPGVYVISAKITVPNTYNAVLCINIYATPTGGSAFTAVSNGADMGNAAIARTLTATGVVKLDAPSTISVYSLGYGAGTVNGTNVVLAAVRLN